MRTDWRFYLPLCLAALSGCSELPPQIAAQVAASSGTPMAPVGAQTPPAPGSPKPAAPVSAASPVDPFIINGLVDLVEKQDRFHVDLSQVQSGTPLGDALALGSPTGYDLRNRFLNLGVPLTEALSRNPDPAFRDKLVTFARWDRAEEVRTVGLITLAATARDEGDMKVFNEALVHLNPAVRFGALEALVVWGHPIQAVPLLAAASEQDHEPILRVYASAGLARLGDPRGLDKLRAFLDDQSWLVKAMAARYLGDFGVAADYDLLVGRLGRETTNDFVVGEYCVAALKLFARKQI